MISAMLLLISWAEFVTETALLISVTIENDQALAELVFSGRCSQPRLCTIVAEMSEAVSATQASQISGNPGKGGS